MSINNKVVNKQIPIKKIIDVANYLENYKEKYTNIFNKEEQRNKNLPYNQKNYEYENGTAQVNYTVEFHNGQNMTESDYNWFIGTFNQPKNIKEITLNLRIYYMTKSPGSTYNDNINSIYVYVSFRDYYESDASSKLTTDAKCLNLAISMPM